MYKPAVLVNAPELVMQFTLKDKLYVNITGVNYFHVNLLENK